MTCTYYGPLSVADPGFGGRGGVNCYKQGRSPCLRHEVRAERGEGQGGGCPPSPSGKKI